MEIMLQETLDYNRRCAEFLKKPIKIYSDTPTITYYNFNNRMLTLNDMKFHSDWNLIIEVVEAIEKLGYQINITGNEVSIDSNIMSMKNISTQGIMNSSNISYFPTIISVTDEELSKKGAILKAINQFLIWYNEDNT